MTLPLSQGVQRAFWQQIQRGLSVYPRQRRRWNSRCATRVGCSGKLGVWPGSVPSSPGSPTASLLRGTRGDRRPRPVRGVETGDRARPGQSAIDHHPRAGSELFLAAAVAERNWRDEQARADSTPSLSSRASPSTTPSSGRDGPDPLKLDTSPQLRAGVRDQAQAQAQSRTDLPGAARGAPSKRPGDVGVRRNHLQSDLRARRGLLKQEVARWLRTGRAMRRPHRTTGDRRGRIPGMVNVSEQQAEGEGSAVPATSGRRPHPRCSRKVGDRHSGGTGRRVS